MSPKTLNLGILAHVDAGKTTLTERLLYAAGVIDEIGSVDRGTTQTDFLELERRRGITIKSAVVSFSLDDVTVNLIDTPGHPDFIAEVERVLSVLDGAVLVVSGVEGVQAQSRILMRALQRLRVPTLLFVNKTDRGGADPERVLAEISDRLTPATVALGRVDGSALRARLFEVLAERNDTLLAAYLDDEDAVTDEQLWAELVDQARRALVHPVFFGSAITGAGIDALRRGIVELLPASHGDAHGPVSGSVFKVERGEAGEKIAYARLFAGTLRVRDRVSVAGGKDAKVTAVGVFDHGGAVRSRAAVAGTICKLWGLADVRVGDPIGIPRGTGDRRFFDRPTLETVVVPTGSSDRAALHSALLQLAEQDPLIDLRQDDVRHELYVSLYGEVQKEVIADTLAADFGIEVEFRETTPICVERVVGTGEAVELLGARANPFLATVGLRIEPAPVDSGVEVRLAVELVSVPLYVYKTVGAFAQALEETVRETLEQGLCGWRVSDCVVTVTRSGYSAPSTGPGDFRRLTPLVLMSALSEAGTQVCEPVHRFRLDGPAESLQPALRALARLRVDPQATAISGSSFAVEGELRAARVHLLQRQVGALTRGEGVLEVAFSHYDPVDGEAPTRARTDHNPLNRAEYLLHVGRRLA